MHWTWVETFPPVLIRAAHFYRALGENERALEQTSRVLKKSLINDPVIFDWYTAEKIPLAEVLSSGMPREPRRRSGVSAVSDGTRPRYGCCKGLGMGAIAS